MSFNDIINNTTNNSINTRYATIAVDKQVCKDNKENKENFSVFKIEEKSQELSKQKKGQSNKDDTVNISIKSCKNITSKQALLLIPITKYFSTKKTLKKLITILKGESISLRLIDWFVTNYCKKFNVLYNLNDFKEKDTISSISSVISSTPAITQASIHTQSSIHTPEPAPAPAPAPATATATATAPASTPPLLIIPQPNPLVPLTLSVQQIKDQSFDNFIIVHNNYKGQLKAYSKKNFDPFCRRNRIRFYYDDNKYFITTVGQLNFFKWALENYIINYIQNNIKAVENDMNLRCEIVKKVSTKLKPQDTSDNNTLINEQILKTKKATGITTRKKRKEISTSSSKTLSIHNLPMTIEFD